MARNVICNMAAAAFLDLLDSSSEGKSVVMCEFIAS